MGLSICKEIMKLHEGVITAKSEGVGMGTTFTISLNCYKKSIYSEINPIMTENKKSKTDNLLNPALYLMVIITIIIVIIIIIIIYYYFCLYYYNYCRTP